MWWLSETKLRKKGLAPSPIKSWSMSYGLWPPQMMTLLITLSFQGFSRDSMGSREPSLSPEKNCLSFTKSRSMLKIRSRITHGQRSSRKSSPRRSAKYAKKSTLISIRISTQTCSWTLPRNSWSWGPPSMRMLKSANPTESTSSLPISIKS